MIVYRERVLPNAISIVLPILLFPSVVAVMLPINAAFAIPVATIITAAFVAYVFFSSPVIEITSTTLTARGATIDLHLIKSVEVIAKEDTFAKLGVELDARAWLSIQASIKGLVKVVISDPNDPTPYWMISTRNPEDLAQILLQK